MTNRLLGIHHVTGIAGSPQENLDFYTGFLGLRLLKVTVNFDDPGSYHFYYGDGVGRPGTILTFFPHEGGYAGKVGAGQTSAVALSIPTNSFEFWIDRLSAEAVQFEGPSLRFGQRTVSFSDPHGTTIELIAADDATAEGWADGPVPADHAIRGIHSVTLLEKGVDQTDSLLAGVMNSSKGEVEGDRTRYTLGESIVDIVADSGAERGRVAVGSIHHVAFRAANDDAQKAWLDQLRALNANVSPIMERDYFRSIYFREPGGVLFEIATDPPGFTVDEPLESLGSSLKLPEWLEPQRASIEAALPPIKLPKQAVNR